ncbi:hypothetical protein GOV03_01040, partial [Candidatus Woesearchaeota archaeon]|nr:hypothetical protein [Candidatus Woesearchaeota archaeon]
MITKKRGLVLGLLVLFLLALSLGRGAAEGCYYAPDSDLYCTSVSEEDALADNENYLAYFSPGISCDDIQPCEKILCTDSCDYEFTSDCEAAGGIEIDEVEVLYNDWCSEGCCDVGPSCVYISGGGTKQECVNLATSQGFDPSEITWITPFIDPEMTGNKCLVDVCQAEILPATLSTCVLDVEGKIIEGAEIETGGIVYPTTVGCLDLELNPGTHLVKASAEGFIPDSKSISLGVDETVEFDFTLQVAMGGAELNGVVTDGVEGIPEVTVAWSGPTEGFVLTNADGSYTAGGLILNEEYIFTVSKYGHITEERAVILVTGEETEENFVLEEIILQGIEGEVWIDENNDGTGDEAVYGASIYVNGLFRGYSQYNPLGRYEVNLGVGEHEIYATYQNYELENKITVIIEEGDRITQPLILTKYVGSCSEDGETPTRPVDIFSANHVLGEEKVRLEWEKPCAEVLGYIIEKDGEFFEEASPSERFLVDLEVEWGETYVYTIVAVYGEDRRSETPTQATITLGNEECEGKYLDGTFTSFCLVGDANRGTVWKCDDTNSLVGYEGCPSNWYCSQVNEVRAICKDSSDCKNNTVQGADPFGLYYEKQTCYGTDDEVTSESAQNYCYFDYTDTVVDQCESCLEVESCFDYQSEDACGINNCVSATCEWITVGQGLSIYVDFGNILFSLASSVSLTTPETGHGYCVEEDYDKEDQCYLCDPGAELFENNFCTAEVCSGLGTCFANDQLTSCEPCGEEADDNHNCYTYGTEWECTGDQPLEVDASGEITLSQDSCGWGRCSWEGTPGGAGSCVKDGDDNDQSDCENLPYGTKICQADNEAPRTTIVPVGANIVSYATPTLTFHAEDRNDLAALGYCAASAEVNVQVCSNFEKIEYLGNSNTDEIELDLVEALGDRINGRTYHLRYYSIDEYSNRENVREAFIFIDTKRPEFEINVAHDTVADVTNLQVYLTGLEEAASCTFELESILPLGELQEVVVGTEESNKEVMFNGLTGIMYDLTVNCEDDYGNTYEETENLVFDLENRVTLIHPRGSVREQSIAFEVSTIAETSCELYKTQGQQKIADFISNDGGRNHKTESISGFFEGEYPGDYYVICRELLTSEVYNPDYFDFVVDFSGPEVQIILTEGLREEYPYEFGWRESFVESVQVSFDCDEDGFGCDKIYYCLTEDDYVTKNNPCYEEFLEPFTIGESTNICYYGDDTGGNLGYPTCGTIDINGYGIFLVNPPHYWYEGEAWGISNEPVFDWEILTKVPTQECKFDWIAEFDYNNIPLYRVLTPGDVDNHYLFEDFPGEVISEYDEDGDVKTVYVKCKDLEGEIGPAQKINLEYDPTAPRILDAFADPDPLYEGIETTINVETDDKTLCRYDENEAEYETMQYSFLGEKIDNLKIAHQDIFTINFNGASKEYNMTTQCKNGADNFSEIEEFNFLVDYTASGNIISTEPSGYIDNTEAMLRVVTNKNARCQYDNGFFETIGGTEHTRLVSSLSEGEHVYLVQCQIGEYDREGQIKFNVDLTPPTITSIEDGNVSCGLSETPNIFVFTDEDALGSYIYELYDDEDNVMIKTETVDATVPFTIAVELIENHTYSLKIQVMDEAGNWGAVAESDGFLAVSADHEKCEEDTEGPRISFVIDNDQCTRVSVEMHCSDETGCREFNYGESFVSALCEAEDRYNGQKLLFEKTAWVCYYAEDMTGKQTRGIKEIRFYDDDGDGIADSCDECPDTGAGEMVDEDGCSSDQVSDDDRDKDTDNDG